MAAIPIVKVVLYDQHVMCLESLAAGLDAPKTVVDVTTNLHELPGVLERARPELCLIDLPTPDRAVLDVLADVRSATPATKIVALVGELPGAFVRAALAAGCRGFARRDSTLRALNDTVDRVAAGQPRVGAALLLRGHASAPPPVLHSPSGHGAALTERESQVLHRLLAGEDTRHIAATLKISRSTARTHVQSIRLKLGVQTRLQAVARAVGAPGSTPRVGTRPAVR